MNFIEIDEKEFDYTLTKGMAGTYLALAIAYVLFRRK